MNLFNLRCQSYNELSINYDGFKAPVMKVLVNDSIISLALSMLGISNKSGYITDGVTVTLNRNSASSASFNLINCYDISTRSFRDKISIGSKISILLGYGSNYKPIFAGYVDALSYEFSENPVVKVTAFDAVKLMMDGGNQERYWKDGDFYIKTFNEIMSKYRDICPVSPTNITPTDKIHGLLIQKTNDYDYIKKTLCMYCDRDFIVWAGQGYLINPYSSSIKAAKLGVGQGILSFSMNPSYKKVSVVVTGDRYANIKAESTLHTGSRYKTSMDSEQKIVKKNVPLRSVSECRLYANRLADEAIKNAQQASVTCIGIPEIIPGRSISISGMGMPWDSYTYSIESATHTFNSSGYRTSFEIKGWH